MSAYSWGRRLATVTMKNIISRGRVNAARKRNQELAAAGTPVRRGRPPTVQEPQVPAQAGTTALPKRPQALSSNEMDRLLGGAARTKRRRLVPQAQADVIMQKSCRFPPY